MEKLEDVFVYDETSPTCLRWKTDRCSGHHGKIISARAGDVAGSLDARGDAFVTRFNGKFAKVHNIVALLKGLDIKDGIVDHEDGDPTNNRISNLRVVTDVINSHNRKKQCNNTSGVTGVGVWTDHRGNQFWKARWQDSVGKRGSKCFSISKYGSDEALKLAAAHREQMINELNNRGHGYTERHGK